MLEANLRKFWSKSLPTYHFDKADVIVSFGADFMGNWGDPDNEKKYSKRRNPKLGNMSKHYQIESTLTLTGSNADERIQIKGHQNKQDYYPIYIMALSGLIQIKESLNWSLL